MATQPQPESALDEQRSARLEAALRRYQAARSPARQQESLDAFDEAVMDFVDHERSLLDYYRPRSHSQPHSRSRRRNLSAPVEPVWDAVKGFLRRHRRYWLVTLGLLCLIGLMLTTGSQHEALSRYAFYLLGAASLVAAYLAGRFRHLKFSLRWSPDTWAFLYFAGLAVVILGSLLQPHGFIFTLDTVWGAHDYTGLRDSASPLSLAPVQGIIFVLRAVLGPALSQSVFILTILTLIGWVMYRATPLRWRLVRFWAGTFYLLNPFVYDRLMSGQWTFLLGYAVLPLAVWAAYRLLRRPTVKHAFWLAVWWTVATIASFHFLYIFGLLFVMLLPIGLLSGDRRGRLAGYWLVTAGLYLVFNLFWIIPLLVAAPSFSYVDYSHLTAFASRPDTVNDVWMSVLLLHGFFGQKGISAATVVPAAPWLFLPILGLALYGVLSALRQRTLRAFTLVLTLSAYITLILAVGVSAVGAREIFVWLFHHLPGFAAMREPQKFLALLAVWYAFFTGYGLVVILDSLRRAWQQVTVLVIAALLVVLQVVPMLGGTGGQLHRVDYPAGWYKVRRTLNESTQGAVLVLPWRQYLHLPFAYNDKLVANPALVMFDQPLYVSRRIDTLGVTEQPDRPIDVVADRLDNGQPLTEADYQVLKGDGVRWIVVLSAPRKPDLGQLTASPRLVLKYQDQNIALFRMLADD